MASDDEGSGPKIAPDLERFVNHPESGLTDEQVIMLSTVFQHGVTALEELYVWLSQRYNNMNPQERRRKAQHATELYFSEKAYDRYAATYEEAQRQGLIPTDGELRKLRLIKGPNNPAKS